ncbi:MAG: alpha/beta fold hydrolase [Gemmatimonadota bacterium]|nr:alpha/beta fold hydrolase [Gemmatimonadota bacterium]
MDSFSGFIGLVATLGSLALIWWPIRLAIAQRMERRFEVAHPRNADGIIIGAEPVLLRGVRPGAILLLHGYNDSPQAVTSLASALHVAGWTVRAPALPGHARTLDAFARSRATDWLASARAELDALRRTHPDVAVCGMSMGGAIAFTLAADVPEVVAVVGLAPYLHLSRAMEVLLVLGPVAALGARYVSGGGTRSVHDPTAAERMIAYRASTPRLLYELTRVTRHAYGRLPYVRQPVLVMQSREDNRIPRKSAQRAFDRIGSPDKTLEWLNGTGHVITVDYGHDALERRVVEWLEARLS